MLRGVLIYKSFNYYLNQKKMKRFTKIILLLLSGTLLVTACKSKKEEDPNPYGNDALTAKGTLLFHLHNYLDIVEVDGYNIVYTTSEGRKISLSRGQFYISEIKLEKLDGTFYSVTDKKILKVQTTDIYEIGEVPVGNYKSVRFKVGLSSSVNAQDPPSSASNILNKPEMWFSGTAQPDGYVFVNIEGKIDTTTAANGATIDMQNFSYHIGTNAAYTQVIMPDKNFTIVKDQAQYVHLLADYNKIFDGIQLNNSNNLTMVSPADNATALGAQLRNNIASMFMYEE
jgi:hypothetical protein